MMRQMRSKSGRAMAVVLGLFVVAGCQNPNWANETAMRAGAPRPDSAAIRERQSARFPLLDERVLLAEATDTLQDLGYTVEESAPDIGVLAGSKDRDATEARQIAAQLAIGLGLALLGVGYQPVWDKDQLIRVTLVTQPQPALGETRMRVSFERIVVNNQGGVRSEVLTSPEFNAGFFALVRNGLAGKGAVR